MLQVLLKGYIGARVTREILLKIKEYFIDNPVRPIELTIQSDGGNFRGIELFIDSINEMENVGLDLHIKIVKAESMAALLALSIGKTRRMHSSSILSLHKGKLELEAAGDFDLETGLICKKIMAAFRKYSLKFDSILDKYKISNNPKKLAMLEGSGWLSLSAEECLKLGIIQEITEDPSRTT